MSHSRVLAHQVQRRYTREAGAHFNLSLPSADESVATMAQTTTFICLARALTDLSVIKILEEVVEERGEEKKCRNNRGGRVRPSDICTSVCVCACVYFSLH